MSGFQFCRSQNSWVLAYDPPPGLLARDDLKQVPSLLTFVGRALKDETLEYLLGYKPSARRKQAFARLQWADSAPLWNRTLVADVNADTRLLKGRRERFFQPGKLIEWVDEQTTVEDLQISFLSRVLLPLTDVMIIFVDDFSNDELTGILQACLQRHSALSPSRLRVVLLQITRPLSSKRFLGQLPGVSECLTNVRVASMSFRGGATKVFERLVSIIKPHQEAAITDRHTSNMLFAESHFAALLNRLSTDFCAHMKTDVNLIEVVKQSAELSVNFDTNAADLIRASNDTLEEMTATICYLSAVLTLLAYPPGAHYFRPSEIFDVMYAGPCLRALQLGGVRQAPELCGIVAQMFTQYAEQLTRGEKVAKDVFIEAVEQVGNDLTQLRSSKRCICLQNMPNPNQSCGHALCDVCVRRFGEPVWGVEYHFYIAQCPVCRDTSGCTVRQVPPTASYRALMLDGGGVRGAFSLELLAKMEGLLSHPYPIQDKFDYIIGTSSGGLISLQLAHKSKSVADCIVEFDTLARRVFYRDSRSPRSILGWLRDWFRAWLRDGFYELTPLEACLSETYGNEQRLFSPPSNGVAGTKVAVTATAISNARLCILTNYNVNDTRLNVCGYKVFRPDNSKLEPLVRDAARATSAAPSIFAAVHIPGLGWVQDGGMGKHNNPAQAAHWECRRIWGKDYAPDFLVSVGTGYFEGPEAEEPMSNFFRLLFHGWLLRGYRSLMSFLNAEYAWTDYFNGLDVAILGNVFRLNHALPGPMALDDVDLMPELRELARACWLEHDVKRLERACMAADFFFELDAEPISRRGWHECLGTIRMRSTQIAHDLTKLLGSYPKAAFVSSTGRSLGAVDDGKVCNTCGLYVKHVRFAIHHLNQMFSIDIDFDGVAHHKISNFPKEASYFVLRQGLSLAFGRDDHQSSFRRSCMSCVRPRRGIKRKASQLGPLRRSKRFCG